MTPLIGSVQFLLLTVVLFALLAALASWVLARPILAAAGRVVPRDRVRLLLGFAGAPAALAFLFTGICLVPWLLSALSLEVDHCESHGGHAHLCFTHPPAASGYVAWVLLALVAAYGLFRLARGVRAFVRARFLLRGLEAVSHHRPEPGIIEVSSVTPVCVAAGLVHPKVIVSSGLVARLSEAELQAVLAHECAHVARRDALWLALARVLVVGHLPELGRRILADIELASELACDEEAARKVGDPLVVASAIVAVGRLIGTRQRAALGFANFGAHALDTRVRALVGEGTGSARAPRLSLFAAVVAAVAIPAADVLHHATETVLSLLLG